MRRAWVPVVLAVGVLAGCAIPSSGPVHAVDTQVDEVTGAVTVAQGPHPGARPSAIVEGFLVAGAAGLTGDFAVAREFLDGPGARSWEPLAQAVVTSATTLEQTADDQVVATVTVVGEVDADGRFSQRSAEPRTVTFDLVKVAGQWRITDPPPGLMVTEQVFEQQYRRTPVYFLTPDRTQVVPDVRFLPAYDLATSVVEALLAGPSPWLRGAVVSAVPQGVHLAEQVRIGDGGVAQVLLEPAAVVRTAPGRDLMIEQITRSLDIPHIRSVQVRAGSGGPLDPPDEPLRVREPREPMMVVDDELVTFRHDVAHVDGVGSLAGLHAVAFNHDTVVALSGTDHLVVLPPGGSAPRTLLTAPSLARPSVDRHGWAWTAPGAVGAGIHAVSADGTQVELVAPWLADRTVHALRVSPEGTRLAVVSTGPDGLVVEVCGIVRD
ncbi:MAG: LpqB family beta-propeller domain-containing protein, partial [Micrococcales bacterium]|nr:LpqB family beta-propeller domain-containing protein [Micrococcales bacterium]